MNFDNGLRATGCILPGSLHRTGDQHDRRDPPLRTEDPALVQSNQCFHIRSGKCLYKIFNFLLVISCQVRSSVAELLEEWKLSDIALLFLWLQQVYSKRQHQASVFTVSRTAPGLHMLTRDYNKEYCRHKAILKYLLWRSMLCH